MKIAQNILNYKAELMGVAILMIIFFHTILPEGAPNWLLATKRYGDVGVDLFLLLGSFTVAGSYLRSRNMRSFYKKRLIRILPAYFLIWGTWHAILNIRYSYGLLYYLEEVFFLNNIIFNNLVHWYIPAILLMYFLTPYFINACKKYQILQFSPLIVALFGMILMWNGNFKSMYFFMFWLRLPVYLLGVILYIHKDFKRTLNPWLMTLLLTVSIVCIRMCEVHYWTNESSEFRRYFQVILAICVVYFWNVKNKYLAWIGGITLELYLLHELIQGLFYDLLSPPWYVYIPISIILAIGIGYIIHRLVDYGLNEFTN